MVKNILTIDVEEWFQVSSFSPYVSRSEWSSYESRIGRQLEKILEILDEYEVKATFFVLGDLAKKHPEYILKIGDQGHELASHSSFHELVFTMSKAEFIADLKRSIDDIELACNQKVVGFRAPSFSITSETKWFFDALAENSILYDSSIIPGNLRYKNSFCERYPHRLASHNIIEYPVSTTKIGRYCIPFSGGLFFRTLPYSFVKKQIQRTNLTGNPAVIYIHSWELDGEQPIIPVSMRAKFVHYYNLGSVEEKFRSLLNDFCFVPVKTTLHTS